LLERRRVEMDVQAFIQEVSEAEKLLFQSRAGGRKPSLAQQQHKRAIEEEELEWQVLAQSVEASNEGLVMRPEVGSDLWRAAERLVSKGKLEKLPRDMGYSVPGQMFKLKI